jgi:hypothetical protein
MSTTQPLAGTDYPVAEWPAGEIVRAQYNFFLSDLKPGMYRLILTVEAENSKQQGQVTTKPFRIEARN